MVTTDPALLTAITEHEAGRFDKAESIYRTRLTESPTDLAALVGLGDVLTDSGRPAEAETFYRRAIAIDSESTAASGAYDGLAAVLQDNGDLDGAVIASKKAALLRGNADDAFGVGNSLEYLGRIDDAVEMFQLAARLRHDFTEAHTKAAQHLMNAGKPAVAATHYQAAVQARPDVAELHCNLATAKQQTGEENHALNSARAAIELKPQLPEAHNLMGIIWKDRGRWADALGALGRAVALKPDFAEALNNSGVVLENIGRMEEAGSYFERAISVRPDIVEFHINLANNLLLRGDYTRGFEEFEWRRANSKNPASRAFPQPMWDGSQLPGRTLLIHGEPAIGQSILFLRFLDVIRQQAGAAAKIVLEVPASIAPIARDMPYINEVVVQGNRLPAFDTHYPLLSMGKAYGLTVETIPPVFGYLTASPSRIAQLAEKLSAYTGTKRIGISWTDLGRVAIGKRERVAPANKLLPLAALPGVTLFNLEQSALPAELKTVDMLTADSTLADTAALIHHMDAVITGDTAVAHLSAALGKKTLVLLSEYPSWPWLLNLANSPWYPTAKIFRQSAKNSWQAVVESAAAAV